MKSKLPVIVAVIVAVAAIFAIKAYMSGMEEEYRQRDKGTKIIGAKTDIKAGDTIEVTMLTPVEVPDRFMPAQAIRSTKGNASTVAGQRAAVPIKAGRPVLWSDLATERRSGFETMVPAGERAFSMKLSAGIKGSLLQPGDHVDILATFALPESKSATQAKLPQPGWRERSDMVNIVLLQNVTVLAVGDTYLPDARGPKSQGEITLAVTLPEAQLLMFAAQHGDLGAVMRKQDDIQTIPRDTLPRVTFETIEKLVGDLDAQRKSRVVEILKGSRVERVNVTDDTMEP